ncbi:MAG TPA: hypothetical protein VGE52_21900 [Pirellulales bacterium]
MNSQRPHYWLFLRLSDQTPGEWSFTLQPADGSAPLYAADVEPEIERDRLELLTLVRALEALDQRSRVTLVGAGVELRRGLRFGLVEWRSLDWQVEVFGELQPLPHADLWQRVDHALTFHEIQQRVWRIDPPHVAPAAPHENSMVAESAKEARDAKRADRRRLVSA